MSHLRYIAVSLSATMLVTGTVFASTILFPIGGGTGNSNTPSYGQILVGNAGGTYTLTATSSLGLPIFAFPFTTVTNYNLTTSATSTPIWAQLGIFASSTSHFNALDILSPLVATSGGTGISTYTTGDILYASNSTTLSKLTIGGTNTVIHGGTTPSYSAVVEGDISLSDISTNNSSASKHGFLPKLSSNSSEFLNGQGAWATPTVGVTTSYVSQTFSSQTSVTVTHNFGAQPVVQVFDTTGAVLIPYTITHSSVNAFTVTFSSSQSGTIIATLGSPELSNYVAVSGTYSVTTNDYTVDCTAGTFTVTLPTAVGVTGKIYVIKNSGAGIITVATTGGQTIDGSATASLNVSGSSLTVQSNGTNWIII